LLIAASLWVEVLSGSLTDAQGNQVTRSSLLVETSSDGTFELLSAGRWQVGPGTVTVRVSMRESGTALDALQMSRLS
jgi:hypothetical protein